MLRSKILKAFCLVTMAAAMAAPMSHAQVVVASVDQPWLVSVQDIWLVERSMEAQAHLVLQAAERYAEEHGGSYPVAVGQFDHLLPGGGLLMNLWTGSHTVPSDGSSRRPGAIRYAPILWKDQSVGCVVELQRFRGPILQLQSGYRWSQPLLEISMPGPEGF